MNKRLYIVALVLTSLSLAGIIFIQGYWIKMAIDDKEEAFTYSIQQVLNNVVKQIEQDEVDNYVAQIIFLRENDSTLKLRDPLLRDFINIQNYRDNKGTFAYNHGVLDEDYELPITTPHSSNDNLDSSFFNSQESYSNSHLVNAYAKLSDLPEIERLMIEELFKNIIRQQSISERVSLHQIQKLIEEKLRKRELNLHFEFAIYNKNVLSKIHSKYFEPNETKEYRALLFGANSNDDSLYELAVIFPQRERFVLSSVIGIASLSTVFMFIIIAVFIITLNQLITQRRISEIKTDFINNMTHEFKTPIATMNLVLDTLKSPMAINNPDKVMHYVKILKQENKRMLAQVENILQISR